MANMDISKENKDSLPKDSATPKKPASLDQVGSAEFYQGEKTAEDTMITEEKKIIKTETIKKEEIYEDKVKKQQAFIESLGRKKEAEEKSDSEQSEYVEKESPKTKKILLSILGVILLGAAVSGGYWFWSKNQQSSFPQEDQGKVVISVNPEPEQEVSQPEQDVEETAPVVLTDPAKLTVKVLNEGSSAGSAGRTKTLLVDKGYTKAIAGNGELDSSGAFVYYGGQATVQDADAVVNILSESGTESKAKEALTSEQKSADIVVVLGET